jgi:uncharacterized protein
MSLKFLFNTTKFIDTSSSYHFVALSDIKLDWLVERGIAGLILDLDNTIVSEDDKYLSPFVEDWINQLKKHDFQMFLVSNGTRKDRFSYWKTRLSISGICKARKPFSKGFKEAMKSMNLDKSQVVVIGDSLHTDILGARILNLTTIQVASLPHAKRWWEKLIGKYIQDPYPSNAPLDLNKKFNLSL